MDLAARKLQLMEQLMGVVSQERIEKIENFFKKEINHDTSVLDEMPDVVKQLIEKSKEESMNGNIRSHSDVMKQVRAKYNLT